MHNNRAYHQEVMHVQIMADRHSRGITELRHRHDDHRPGYLLRQARREHGHVRRRARSPIRRIWARPSSARIEVVKRGEPALVDVSRSLDDNRNCIDKEKRVIEI